MTAFPWRIYAWSKTKDWWEPLVGPDAEELCFAAAQEARTFAHKHCKEYVTWVGMKEQQE